MSNKLAVTEGGVHKVGKKAFLTVDGIHRKVKKALLTVGGVLQLCYSAILALYDGGNEYTAETGGWSKGAYGRGSATVTKNAADITLYAAGVNQTATVLTNSLVDVTGYSKMYAEVTYTATNANGHFTVGLSDSRETSSNMSFETDHMRVATSWGTASGTIEVDLSGVSGAYYPYVCIDRWSSGSSGTLVVKKVWMA